MTSKGVPNGRHKWTEGDRSETARVTASVASNTLSVKVLTAPGKATVGERPGPFRETLGFAATYAILTVTLSRLVRAPTSNTVNAEPEARYLQDFDRVQKTATSDQEPFDHMTVLYLHWVANQSWLMFGFPYGSSDFRRLSSKTFRRCRF